MLHLVSMYPCFIIQPWPSSHKLKCYITIGSSITNNTSPHPATLIFFFFLKHFLVPCRKFQSPYQSKTQQPQEQRYPFLSVCAVFVCVQTMVWLPMFGISNVRTDVDACDSTQGLYRCHKRVCTGSWLWKKKKLPHQGLEPMSVLRLAFRLGALPSELSRPLLLCCNLWAKHGSQSSGFLHEILFDCDTDSLKLLECLTAWKPEAFVRVC